MSPISNVYNISGDVVLSILPNDHLLFFPKPLLFFFFFCFFSTTQLVNFLKRKLEIRAAADDDILRSAMLTNGRCWHCLFITKLKFYNLD